MSSSLVELEACSSTNDVPEPSMDQSNVHTFRYIFRIEDWSNVHSASGSFRNHNTEWKITVKREYPYIRCLVHLDGYNLNQGCLNGRVVCSFLAGDDEIPKVTDTMLKLMVEQEKTKYPMTRFKAGSVEKCFRWTLREEALEKIVGRRSGKPDERKLCLVIQHDAYQSIEKALKNNADGNADAVTRGDDCVNDKDWPNMDKMDHKKKMAELIHSQQLPMNMSWITANGKEIQSYRMLFEALRPSLKILFAEQEAMLNKKFPHKKGMVRVKMMTTHVPYEVALYCTAAYLSNLSKDDAERGGLDLQINSIPDRHLVIAMEFCSENGMTFVEDAILDRMLQQMNPRNAAQFYEALYSTRMYLGSREKRDRVCRIMDSYVCENYQFIIRTVAHKRASSGFIAMVNRRTFAYRYNRFMSYKMVKGWKSYLSRIKVGKAEENDLFNVPTNGPSLDEERKRVKVTAEIDESLAADVFD